MGNQVAAPCCGSCKHCQCKREWYCCYFQYEEKKKRLEELQAQIGDDWTENDEADDLHGELYDWEESNFKELTDSCTNHTPRNPIPIIELSGVKRLMTSAYIKGLAEDPNDFLGDRLAHYQDMASKYIKALEAK